MGSRRVPFLSPPESGAGTEGTPTSVPVLPSSRVLNGYPWWSQLADPDPRTHRPDIYATTDCGEECVSIWIQGKLGKYTDAADLRRQLQGPRTDGRTTGRDLALLLSLHAISAVPDLVPPVALRDAVRARISQNEPVAALGEWVQQGVLHWVLGIGYGNDSFIVMEPWSGRMTCYRWAVVQLLARGEIVRQSP